MTHKFVIVVEKNFYDLIQNNNDFYLRVLVLDVIRVLTNQEEAVKKYTIDLFNKCAASIYKEIKMFEDENTYLFYLELSSGYLDDFFEKPLDDLE